MNNRTSELTERDCGELKHNKPRIYITPLTWEIKRLWAAGHKQGQIVKMTGAKIDYVKKMTACFSRALNIPYRTNGEGQNPEKEVQQTQKNRAKNPGAKKRKSLSLNFSNPIHRCDTLHGFTKHRNRGWKAQIRIGKKVKYLGIYATVQDAAKAYNKEAGRVFGKYANLNKI